MKVRILIGAEGAYACIDNQSVKMDVRLNPGRAAWTSLRDSAEELREQAAKLQRRALLMQEAAQELEHGRS